MVLLQKRWCGYIMQTLEDRDQVDALFLETDRLCCKSRIRTKRIEEKKGVRSGCIGKPEPSQKKEKILYFLENSRKEALFNR